MDHGVGEPCAVHVEAEPALLRQRADRSDFEGKVHAAVFGGVGDRDRVRLDAVDVVGDRVDDCADRVGGQFGPVAVSEEQLGAVGVEFGRAALIVLDVRVAVADDPAVRRAQCGEREAVGGGAGGDPEHRDLGLEQFGQPAVELLAPRVAGIGGVERVGGGDRGHDLRVDRGGVVGEKAHG